MPRRLILSLLAILVAPLHAAEGATPALVEDLNTFRNPFAQFRGAQPRGLMPFGDRVVFLAEEETEGQMLWISDGTSEGTRLLYDGSPGGGFFSEFQLLGTVGQRFFFAVGSTLWTTDGTRAGTQPVTAIDPGHHHGRLLTLTPRDVYFTRCSSVIACALWKTDGTSGGTVRVADLGNRYGLPTYVRSLFLGGRLFFLIADGDRRALWVSDGTSAGTRLLRELNGQFYPYAPPLFAGAGSRVFFIARADGDELWTSDGTVGGTRALTELQAQEPFLVTRFLKSLGDRIYFVADDVLHGTELWSSDGTPGGTRQVTDFGFADAFGGQFQESQLQRLGGRLYFVATDGLTPHRLWSSGGTPATTAALAGCSPKCPVLQADAQLTPLPGRLLFPGSWTSGSIRLGVTDGTGSGTRPLGGICPRGCSAQPRFLASVPALAFFQVGGDLVRTDGTDAGSRTLAPVLDPYYPLESWTTAAGKLFFAADDHRYGSQLWVSDGTVAGTREVTVIGSNPPDSRPQRLGALGDRALFSACAPGRSVWASRGLPTNTEIVAPFDDPCEDYSSYSTIDGFVAAAGRGFFLRANQLGETELWTTDGTAAGTALLHTFAPGTRAFPLLFEGRLLLAVGDPDRRWSLWSSDGTAAGTAKLFDLPAALFAVETPTAVGDEVYFVGASENSSSGPLHQLWRSDGTPVGTTQISSFTAPILGISGHPPYFTRLGGVVYFVGLPSNCSSFDCSYVLWRSDGTPQGTRMVSDAPPSQQPTDIFDLQVFQGRLVFTANEGNRARRSVWISDGTPEGTHRLVQLPEASQFPAVIALFTSDGQRLFWSADDGAFGRELWSSDGTEAGTSAVRSFAEVMTEAIAIAGKLYFTAHDGVHGFELWSSDGTAGGTRLVQDIFPDGFSSRPAAFTLAGTRLFFSADDGVHGREPWVLPLDGVEPPCEPSATALCLDGGRFRVEASWRDFQDRSGAGRAVSLTDDTGYFWFFDPANVEVVIKLIDGRPVNGHFWGFYGALSSVEYTLTVTDTLTGAARRYFNPSGRLASVADTTAFGPLGATGSALSLGPTGEAAVASVRASETVAQVAPCVAGAQRLCLNGGRFAVDIEWRTKEDGGSGQAVGLTGDTGYFWFFSQANVEVLIKILDGRPLNGKFWLFYAALSDVEYTLTVTDTQTGRTKSYFNPAGRLASVADTAAF